MSARRRWRSARRSRKRADVDYTHKKQTGGSGQFARVKMTIEPNEAGKGFEFENKVVGGNVPKEYIPGVAKGVQSVVEIGVLAGFPMLDVKVTLTDGAYHDVDSRYGVRDRRAAPPSAKARSRRDRSCSSRS